MFGQTCTIFHKTSSGETDTWAPETVKHCHLQTASGIDATGQQTASAPASTLIVRADDWPTVAPGDYVVPGKSSHAAFTGSASKVLIPLGGMRIESITAHCYGSSMDHYEVVVR